MLEGKAVAALLGPCFNRFNNVCIPRVLVPTLHRLRRTFIDTRGSPRFRTRFGSLLGGCTKHPATLAGYRGVATKAGAALCLGHRSLLRNNTRGAGRILKRTLLTGQVNGARVVTRANTNRRNITSTLTDTLLNLGYHVCVNTGSIRHRSPGIFHVHLVNTRIVPIRDNSTALGSTYGRTLHS